MKVQFAVLASISLLSFGAIVGCTTPAATTKIPTNTGIAVSSDPCASQADSCKSKENLGAPQSNSIGAPLAQALQGKPVVVDIYASWCPACKNIAPTLSQLEKNYEGKVNFVVLDVSDRTTTAAAEAKASQLGLSKFLEANKSQTGMLAIVDPATGNILAQYRNNANLADYTTVLDTALAH